MSTEIALIDQDIAAAVGFLASPATKSARLAEYARDALAEGQRINRDALGYVPGHKTTVDGTEGKSEASVRPDGEIVYVFSLLGDVIVEIMNLLLDASPVDTGRYRALHIAMANGTPFDPDSGDEPPAADEYVIVNVAPYARKIERGLSSQASAVYEGVAAIAAQRFSNRARVSFEFRPASGPALDRWAAATTQTGGRRAELRAEWLVRQPAIVISPRG